MNERPIIFSTEMVRAILEGRKTQTRRIVKPQPEDFEPGEGRWRSPIGCEYYNPTKVNEKTGDEYPGKEVFGFADEREGWVCPYGAPGDRLWVRESFGRKSYSYDIIYKADYDEAHLTKGVLTWRWKPSIHLKRKDARLFLEITNIRVERLQNISWEDCQAEGVKWQWNGNCEECYQWSVSGDKSKEDVWFDYAEGCYEELWNVIHKKENRWKDNPWVWVIEFKRI